MEGTAAGMRVFGIVDIQPAPTELLLRLGKPGGGFIVTSVFCRSIPDVGTPSGKPQSLMDLTASRSVWLVGKKTSVTGTGFSGGRTTTTNSSSSGGEDERLFLVALPVSPAFFPLLPPFFPLPPFISPFFSLFFGLTF